MSSQASEKLIRAYSSIVAPMVQRFCEDLFQTSPMLKDPLVWSSMRV